MIASQPAGLLTPNGTFFAELIAFILMILVLGRWVYPRIIAAATERESKIEAGLRMAQEAEERLAKVQEQVEKTLEEARTQARDILNRSHWRGDGGGAGGHRQSEGRCGGVDRACARRDRWRA